jgi:hypothetical protein
MKPSIELIWIKPEIITLNSNATQNGITFQNEEQSNCCYS